MDASILENQLRQKLRKKSSLQRNLALGDEEQQGTEETSEETTTSRPSSAEPSSSISRTSSRQEIKSVDPKNYPPLAPLAKDPALSVRPADYPPLPSIVRPASVDTSRPPLPSQGSFRSTHSSPIPTAGSVTSPTSSPMKPFSLGDDVASLLSSVKGNGTGASMGQLKRQFLPEAPPVPTVEEPPTKQASKELKPAAPAKDDDDFSDEETETGKDTKKAGTGEDDDWETGEENTKATPAQIDRFATLVAQLREWFVSKSVSLAGSRSIDEELKSGIALCKLFVQLNGNDKLLSEVQFDYTPALASLSEWKNVEVFLKYCTDTYPETAKLRCEVKDLFNGSNIPKFLTLLFVLAKETGYRFDNGAIRGLEVDRKMLNKQNTHQFANALTVLDESEHKKASQVYQWLKEIKLETYFDLLDSNGWDDMERLSLITEEELRGLGIKKEGHIRAIMKRLQDISLVSQWITCWQTTAVPLDFLQPAAELNAPGPLSTDEMGLATTSDDLHDAAATLTALETSLKQQQQQPPKSSEALAEAIGVASHLLRLVPDGTPIVVVDFTSHGYAFAGVAGSVVPPVTVPFDQKESMSGSPDFVVGIIQRAVDKLGISNSPPPSIFRRPRPKLFVSGAPTMRAVQEKLLAIAPDGMFVCGPKSSATLALRAVGLVDGVSVDVDASGVARAIAVSGGRAIPAGFATEFVGVESAGENQQIVQEEADRKRNKALTSLVANCLAECGFGPQTNKRVRGGLVVTGARLSVTPAILKRFSAGVFCLPPSARWGASSQVAINTEFQHRWVVSLKEKYEDQLFPLMNGALRRRMALQSVRVATILKQTLWLKDQAASMDDVNKRNASTPQFVTSLTPQPPLRSPAHKALSAGGSQRNLASSFKDDGTAKAPRVPPRPITKAASFSKAPSPAPVVTMPSSPVRNPPLPQRHRTGIASVDANIYRLLELVGDTDEALVVDFKTILLADQQKTHRELSGHKFEELLRLLPEGMRKRLNKAGVTIMDEDEVEADLVDML